MSLKTGTKIRILATALLLAATALGGTQRPSGFKNATGCSYSEGRPRLSGCTGDTGGSCYDCLYSDPYGIIECSESPDGSTMICRPFIQN